MKKNKNICILSFSNVGKDMRIQREIEIARIHFKVTVLGYGAWEPCDNVKYIQLTKTRRTKAFLFCYLLKLLFGHLSNRFYKAAFWAKSEYENAVSIINESNFSLVHANDWDSLPVAIEAVKGKNTKVLFDAHEFSLEQEAEKYFWRLFVKPYREYLFNRYLKKADAMITVSAGLQALYLQHFSMKSDLIMNATPFKMFQFSSTEEKKISIIHHGNAVRNRYIEEMIRMISFTDQRFVLYLMLVERSGKKYVPFLKKFAQKTAPGKVVFISPVDESEVLETISAFDIGLPFLKASQKNIYNALPNKFFHYVMVGLAVVIPPLPSMAEIIEREGIGCVAPSENPAVFANFINNLDCKGIDEYKKRSLLLAKRMNAEIEMSKLLTIYQKLLVDYN